MALLCDSEIKALAEQGMITPYTPKLIRQVDRGVVDPSMINVISYGSSSYGYDIRLSPREFLVFNRVPGAITDPKRFNKNALRPVDMYYDDNEGDYFILPAHSYGLGVALERLKVPPNVTVICLGKSTYARCGVIINMTPAEAGWCGHLTLEMSNSSSSDCRIYADEGIAQLLFFEGKPCETTYEARAGKYQNQPHAVTLARL